MKPERLIYTFVSYASHYDTEWGKGVAVAGIELTAQLAHKYGIPVTWIVNRGSIPLLQERIREWHASYGDDVILQCPFFEEEANASKEKLRRRLEEDWALLQEAFPWAITKVAGRGKIYNEVIEVLEELDFQGMWGYCWEQVWWDGITHKGIPWGSWYIDSARFNAPHAGKGGVVACEWTARDLHLAYHTESPVLYSTDPNDVLRAGLCTGEDIRYWQILFDEYLMNTEHNQEVYFLQQQEAHEMEDSERFAVFPAGHAAACAEMLDRFFQYVTGFPVTLTTLPQAIDTYHLNNEVTAPVYMLTRDKPFRPAINEYTMALGGTSQGAWPATFFYYDSECQMVFVEGEGKPRLLRNYSGGRLAESGAGAFEELVPPTFVKEYMRKENYIKLRFVIDSAREIPFGLAYWDQLDGFRIVASSEGVQAKLIGDELAFLRLDLPVGTTTVYLELEKNESGREE